MTSDSEFNTIRPYCDSEIEAAIERLCKSEEFLTLFTHLTKMDRATIQGALQGIRSRAEFQAKFFGPAIQSPVSYTHLDVYKRQTQRGLLFHSQVACRRR